MDDNAAEVNCKLADVAECNTVGSSLVTGAGEELGNAIAEELEKGECGGCHKLAVAYVGEIGAAKYGVTKRSAAGKLGYFVNVTECEKTC